MFNNFQPNFGKKLTNLHIFQPILGKNQPICTFFNQVTHFSTNFQPICTFFEHFWEKINQFWKKNQEFWQKIKNFRKKSTNFHIFLHFGTFWNIFWQKINKIAHF